MVIIQRVKNGLARLLGRYYAPTVLIVERASTVFAATFLGKLVGSGIDIHNVVQVSYWETAAVAGIAAALVVVQSAISNLVTGVPTLLSPVSRTLRSYRERPIKSRPQHKIPVVNPKGRL